MKLWKVTTTAIRVAVPVAAVKLSYDYGVWGTNTSKSNETYERIKNVVLPGTVEYPKQSVPAPFLSEPGPGRMKEYVGSAYDASSSAVYESLGIVLHSELPRPDEVKESARLKWNSYVRCAFDGVENLDKIACSTYRKIKAQFSS